MIDFVAVMADANGSRNARAPDATARPATEEVIARTPCSVPQQDSESSASRAGCSGVLAWPYRDHADRPRKNGGQTSDGHHGALDSMITTARRSLAGHPAFVPLIALWFAALLGLTLAVLPAPVLERALTAAGLGGLSPLTLPIRVAASAVSAAIGALIGYGFARPFARRAAGDPRPVYAESEPPFDYATSNEPARRPLRVREEFGGGFGDQSEVAPSASMETAATGLPGAAGELVDETCAQEGFMILTPQPVHPPRPEPDLEALLDQFDSAFEAFRSGETTSSKTDPVQAFVARQTGVASPAPATATSPLGGLMPDHQAELRAALDKLAQSQRGE